MKKLIKKSITNKDYVCKRKIGLKVLKILKLKLKDLKLEISSKEKDLKALDNFLINSDLKHFGDTKK